MNRTAAPRLTRIDRCADLPTGELCAQYDHALAGRLPSGTTATVRVRRLHQLLELVLQRVRAHDADAATWLRESFSWHTHDRAVKAAR